MARYASPGGSLLARYVAWVRVPDPSSRGGAPFEGMLMENVARPPPGVARGTRLPFAPFDMKGIRLYDHERRFEATFGRRGLKALASPPFPPCPRPSRPAPALPALPPPCPPCPRPAAAAVAGSVSPPQAVAASSGGGGGASASGGSGGDGGGFRRRASRGPHTACVCLQVPARTLASLTKALDADVELLTARNLVKDSSHPVVVPSRASRLDPSRELFP